MFTLITSDGISISLDPEVLTANSVVFIDMIELAGGNDDLQQCSVTETESSMRLLLKSFDGTSRLLNIRQAETLFELADKYDAPRLMLQIKLFLCQFIDRVAPGENALRAYALAARMGNRKLLVAASKRAWSSAMTWDGINCPAEDKQELESLRLKRRNAALDLLLCYDYKRADRCTKLNLNGDSEWWASWSFTIASARRQSDFGMNETLPALVTEHLLKAEEMCYSCKTYGRSVVNTLKRRWHLLPNSV